MANRHPKTVRVLTYDERLEGEYPVSHFAAGSFSNVYRITGGKRKGYVLYIPKHAGDSDTPDYGKDIAATCHREHPHNPHLPAVEHIGYLDRDAVYPIYTAPEYARLNREEHPAARGQHKTLERLLQQARMETPLYTNVSGYGSYSGDYGRRANEYFMELAQALPPGTLPDVLLNALERLIVWASSHAGDMQLNFARCNVAVGPEGHLILLDVLESRHAIARINNERAKRYAGRY